MVIFLTICIIAYFAVGIYFVAYGLFFIVAVEGDFGWASYVKIVVGGLLFWPFVFLPSGVWAAVSILLLASGLIYGSIKLMHMMIG